MSSEGKRWPHFENCGMADTTQPCACLRRRASEVERLEAEVRRLMILRATDGPVIERLREALTRIVNGIYAHSDDPDAEFARAALADKERTAA